MNNNDFKIHNVTLSDCSLRDDQIVIFDKIKSLVQTGSKHVTAIMPPRFGCSFVLKSVLNWYLNDNSDKTILLLTSNPMAKEDLMLTLQDGYKLSKPMVKIETINDAFMKGIVQSQYSSTIFSIMNNGL